MQDIDASLANSVKSAASFLEKREADRILDLVRSLEKLYCFRALNLKEDESDVTLSERLIRIAIPIESELFRIEGSDHQDVLRGYSLVASIFEHAARIKTEENEESQRFWLRASLSYLQAKKSANSIVCAKRANALLKTKDDLQSEVIDIVHALLMRRLDLIRPNSELRRTLQAAVQKNGFSSIMEQSQTLGLFELVNGVVAISDYLKDGKAEDSWRGHLDRALRHFMTSGDAYMTWLVSRLEKGSSKLLENALWNLRDIVPDTIIKAFTQHPKAPIFDLWDNQLLAIRAILGSNARKNYSLIMPTSAGKTLVASIVAAKELISRPGNCFYVTPYKALVTEVAEFLSLYLPSVGIHVSYLPGKYDAIPELDDLVGRSGRMYVLTPEKLDLLWRTSDPRVKDSAIFIFDEIQNITEEGRGLRLELLVSKIKKSFSHGARVILLSAVIPESNLASLVEWLGRSNSDGSFLKWKPTRTLEAVFWRGRMDDNRGDIHYIDRFNIVGILPPTQQYTRRNDASELALKYEKRLGPVLVYCNSKDEAELMATAITNKAEIDLQDKKVLEKAAEEIGSILGRNYPLHEMIMKGVAYHHASLPDSVKKIIEDLGRRGILRIICCTTTLVEGVNLSVGTVIISSTFQGSVSMDGLKLRNLAGRAGRALKDTEGHVVLMDAAARQSLTDDAYARFESRFFQYLSGIASIDKFDTDIDALESDLLSRFYKREISTNDVEDGAKKILESTLFYKQSNVDEYRSALASVQNHTRKVSGFLPNLDETELKVFAETGLGIRHCQSLNELAKRFAAGQELMFRSNNEVNWSQVMQLVDACLLPSTAFGVRIRKIINDPLKAVQGWLYGKTLLEIAQEIEKNPSRKVMRATSTFLYGYVADEVSWACAALLKLIDQNKSKEISQNLDYEYYLLPSYLTYGVSNPAGLLLRLAGMEDREMVNRLVSGYKVPQQNGKIDWIGVISWIINLEVPVLAEVQRILINSLSSFTVPLKFFAGEVGACQIERDGRVLQNGTEVGRLLDSHVPILAISLARPCAFRAFKNTSGESFLQVTPM